MTCMCDFTDFYIHWHDLYAKSGFDLSKQQHVKQTIRNFGTKTGNWLFNLEKLLLK